MILLSASLLFTFVHSIACAPGEAIQGNYYVDSDGEAYVAAVTSISGKIVEFTVSNNDGCIKQIRLQDEQTAIALRKGGTTCIQDVTFTYMDMPAQSCLRPGKLYSKLMPPACVGKHVTAVYHTDCSQMSFIRKKRFLSKIFDGLKDAKKFVVKTAEGALDTVKDAGKKVLKKVRPHLDKAGERIKSGVKHVAKKIHSGVKHVAKKIHSGVKHVVKKIKDFVYNRK